MSLILSTYKVDVILHFAAQTHVDNSFGDSFEFTKNNILGTHVLLESVRCQAPNLVRFIHVSTDEVYGEVFASDPACKEESIMAPTNPYAATKAAAECLVMAYHKSFNLPTIITRSNNVYGPYQYPEKACSKFICQLWRDDPIYIHGDGSNSRRYLYAADVANAIDIILHRGQVGETYNIGTHFEITNLELATYLVRRFAFMRARDPALELPRVIRHVEDRAFNDRRYEVDFGKLKKLGWTPRMSFEKGISKTIWWYGRYGETWWGDITSALVPHPGKQFPTTATP